jgi:hypothetical protein
MSTSADFKTFKVGDKVTSVFYPGFVWRVTSFNCFDCCNSITGELVEYPKESPDNYWTLEQLVERYTKAYFSVYHLHLVEN